MPPPARSGVNFGPSSAGVKPGIRVRFGPTWKKVEVKLAGTPPESNRMIEALAAVAEPPQS